MILHSRNQKSGKVSLTFVDSFFDVVIHAQSSPGVEVPTKPKGSLHRRAVGHVRQDTQLQLTVVGHHQGVPFGQICCERLSHLHLTTTFCEVIPHVPPCMAMYMLAACR